MKKLLIILCLLTFALPTFSASGYDENCGFKFYDDKGTQAYAQKLEKEYHAKADRGELKCDGYNYNKYVLIPVFEYIENHPINYNKTSN